MDRIELTNKHAENPEAGDYWNEMLCPVAVILDVKNSHVILCRTTKRMDDGWTWDIGKPELMSKQEFKDWISYDGIDGYWCDVSKNKHEWAVDIFNAA